MKGVMFYRFPNPKKQLLKCKQWVQACGFSLTTLPKFDYTKSAKFVCSKHFVDGKGPNCENPININFKATTSICQQHHLKSLPQQNSASDDIRLQSKSSKCKEISFDEFEEFNVTTSADQFGILKKSTTVTLRYEPSLNIMDPTPTTQMSPLYDSPTKLSPATPMNIDFATTTFKIIFHLKTLRQILCYLTSQVILKSIIYQELCLPLIWKIVQKLWN